MYEEGRNRGTEGRGIKGGLAFEQGQAAMKMRNNFRHAAITCSIAKLGVTHVADQLGLSPDCILSTAEFPARS
jgi:hypothetical protein